MKARLSGTGIALCGMFMGSALAQDTVRTDNAVDQAAVPPPLPPKVQAPGPGLEPTVTITTDEDGHVIEEYRIPGGQVYMVKVIPKNAPPYYLHDPDGDGEFVADKGTDPGLAPVTWKVREWK